MVYSVKQFTLQAVTDRSDKWISFPVDLLWLTRWNASRNRTRSKVMDYNKNVNTSLLIDFYGDMLSEKQREAMELYYNEDLSLAEVADITGLTRPGVRDRLMKSEAILRNLEEKLGLLKRFEEMTSEIELITKELEAHKNGKTVDLDDIIDRLKKLS